MPSERARREHHLGPLLWHNTIHRPSPKHLHRCTHCGPCIIQFKPQCTNRTGRYIEDLPVGVGYRPGEGAFNGVTVPVMCLPLPRVPRRGEGVVGWLSVVLSYYFGCCRFTRPPPLCRRSGKGPCLTTADAQSHQCLHTHSDASVRLASHLHVITMRHLVVDRVVLVVPLCRPPSNPSSHTSGFSSRCRKTGTTAAMLSFL